VKIAKIIAIQLNKNRNRVDIILDDTTSFSIDKKVAQEAGLRKGVDLNEEQLEKLTEADVYFRCYDSALTFLSYRARSEFEIKQRLRKHGFNDDIIVRVIDRLREQKLIDDLSFANYWKENRLNSNPKSKRSIKYELIGKGIPGEIALEATSDIDDSANAYRAGLKKARLLFCLDYNEFRKRLSNYLKWRGFSYTTINNVVELLWKEKQKIS
jgi:regulatory protein